MLETWDKKHPSSWKLRHRELRNSKTTIRSREAVLARAGPVVARPLAAAWRDDPRALDRNRGAHCITDRLFVVVSLF